MRALLICLVLAAALPGCSKCDVPVMGFAGWLAPAACAGDAPRR
ncbi:MAG: hypothetical protein ACRCTI_07185 [Beijerinckiaceae bacterium]